MEKLTRAESQGRDSQASHLLIKGQTGIRFPSKSVVKAPLIFSGSLLVLKKQIIIIIIAGKGNGNGRKARVYYSPFVYV